MVPHSPFLYEHGQEPSNGFLLTSPSAPGVLWRPPSPPELSWESQSPSVSPGAPSATGGWSPPGFHRTPADRKSTIINTGFMKSYLFSCEYTAIPPLYCIGINVCNMDYRSSCNFRSLTGPYALIVTGALIWEAVTYCTGKKISVAWLWNLPGSPLGCRKDLEDHPDRGTVWPLHCLWRMWIQI